MIFLVQSSLHANCNVMFICLPCGEWQFIAFAGLTCYSLERFLLVYDLFGDKKVAV